MKHRLSGLMWAVAFVAVMPAGGFLAPTPARADVSIFDIQTGVYPELTIVQCDSVVVTGAGMFGYFVQEPKPHPTYGRKFSGIWVYTGTDHTMHKGDIVSLRGTYKEYYLSGELDIPAAGVQGSQILMGTAPIPNPVSVRIAEVNDSGADAEAYEGVFIRIDRDDPTLSSLREYPGLYGKWYWTITTGAGGTGDSLSVYHESYKPGDDFSYGAPDAATSLTYLRGILQYTRGRYRLAPRSCEEDFGAPCKPRLNGAYATGSSTMSVQFDTNVDQASASNPGNYELASSAIVYTAQRDPVILNTVHLTTEPLPAGAPETIFVSGVHSTGGLPMDGTQTSDFRSGITPIDQIQFVANPAFADSSSLKGKVVTVEGRVTAVEGSYYYLQEGNGGQWKGLYCRVAKTGLLQVGDRVQASGEITEYYGMTELVYKAGIDNFHHLGTDPNPVAVNLLTTANLHYRDPAGPSYKSAERWEGCLVKILNVTFRDSIPGVPGPYIDEWLLASTPATADTAMIDLSVADGSYNACSGNRADVTGILSYAYDKYRIYSHGQDDITPIYDSCPPPVLGACCIGDYCTLMHSWDCSSGVFWGGECLPGLCNALGPVCPYAGMDSLPDTKMAFLYQHPNANTMDPRPIVASGPTVVTRQAPAFDEDGHGEIQTEITSMTLTGVYNPAGCTPAEQMPVTIELDQTPTTGSIVSSVSGGIPDFPDHSVFDSVHVRIRIGDLGPFSYTVAQMQRDLTSANLWGKRPGDPPCVDPEGPYQPPPGPGDLHRHVPCPPPDEPGCCQLLPEAGGGCFYTTRAMCDQLPAYRFSPDSLCSSVQCMYACQPAEVPEHGPGTTPKELTLEVLPNPVAASVVVRYATPHGGRTTLDVYDSSGRHVRNLLDQEVQAGLRFLSWNQSASDGRKLPAGVYMIRLRSVQGTKAVRMVVLR